MSLEGMRIKMNGPNYYHVGPMVELQAFIADVWLPCERVNNHLINSLDHRDDMPIVHLKNIINHYKFFNNISSV